MVTHSLCSAFVPKEEVFLALLSNYTLDSSLHLFKTNQLAKQPTSLLPIFSTYLPLSFPISSIVNTKKTAIFDPALPASPTLTAQPLRTSHLHSWFPFPDFQPLPPPTAVCWPSFTKVLHDTLVAKAKNSSHFSLIDVPNVHSDGSLC